MLRFMSQVVFLLLVIVSGFWLFSQLKPTSDAQLHAFGFHECGMTKRSLQTPEPCHFSGA